MAEAPPWKLDVPDLVDDVIRTLHPGLKRKIRAALDGIRSDPTSGKALQDDLEGLRSVRVSHFRIIYRLEGRRIVKLIALGPRRTIYQETTRMERRERAEER